MNTQTIAHVIADARKKSGTSDTAKLDAEVLLAHTLNCDRTYLYTWSDKELTSAQQELFSTQWQRRMQGEPIAYITGKKEFWSLPLEVNASTLIPRPETELLVEVALQKMSHNTLSNFVEVLDLGTGTGAIALALATEQPAWQILACDVKPETVHLAQRNVRALGIHNVTCVVSDWFAQIHNKQFDLIVSNPPYIDAMDDHLKQGDLRFEPKTALVAANRGLADIEKIISQAPAYLKAKGWLMLEHGFAQAEEVRRLFTQQGYADVETCRDLAGHERVTIGACPRG